MKSFDKLKKWFEIAPKLSPLTNPTSQEATVLSVKSLDPSKREQALKRFNFFSYLNLTIILVF